MPIVIKADGLAAGKGVIIPDDLAEAEAAIDMMFEGGLGAAGAEVVVEEFLVGEEASFFALCDGETAIPLASAQDHKRVGDGDTGPNTGGMGAYSPAPVMTPQMTARTMDEIIVPTMRAMKAMGAPYKGVLFAGLMITKDGPKLIEYNARFGDPETQVLMLRLMSDLLPALIASRDGQLKSFDLRWYPDAALTVVMAAKGYPGEYKRGSVIEGLDEAAAVEGVEIFHAGTKADGGKILANGGRVLNVSARGKTVSEAQARAYRRSTGSNGRRASAAATSAGRRCGGKRACSRTSIADESPLRGDQGTQHGSDHAPLRGTSSAAARRLCRCRRWRG